MKTASWGDLRRQELQVRGHGEAATTGDQATDVVKKERGDAELGQQEHACGKGRCSASCSREPAGSRSSASARMQSTAAAEAGPRGRGDEARGKTSDGGRGRAGLRARLTGTGGGGRRVLGEPGTISWRWGMATERRRSAAAARDRARGDGAASRDRKSHV